VASRSPTVSTRTGEEPDSARSHLSPSSRVYVIAFLKLVDFLWGVAGWCTIGTTFGKVPSRLSPALTAPRDSPSCP
jgi:hypothetical protein